MRPHSPSAWARFGPLSRWLAKRRPPKAPPILVLSLGRSGSTWVGATLGQAADALYLHEPLTQSLLAAGPHETNFDVDPHQPPGALRRWADDAFAGLPAFPTDPAKPNLIVRQAAQWAYGERTRRRLVIKEINPFAGPWLLRHYRPKVIYLVRHPAAVAASNNRLGFLRGDDRWRAQGRHQGRAHQLMQACLQHAPHRVVSFEALCDDPVPMFRDLFEFAELRWDDGIVAFIHAHSEAGDRSRPYDISRNSREMITSWQSEIKARELSELRQAYAAYDLPWYRDDREWQLSTAA